MNAAPLNGISHLQTGAVLGILVCDHLAEAGT